MAEIEIQEIEQKEKPLTFWIKFAGTLGGSILIAFAIIFLLEHFLDSSKGSEKQSLSLPNFYAKEKVHNDINKMDTEPEAQHIEDVLQRHFPVAGYDAPPESMREVPQRSSKQQENASFPVYFCLVLSICTNVLLIFVVIYFFMKTSSLNIDLIDAILLRENREISSKS